MISKLPCSRSKFCNKSLFDPLKKIILELQTRNIAKMTSIKSKETVLFQTTTVFGKKNQTVTVINSLSYQSFFRLTNTEYLALNPYLTPPIFGSNYAGDVSSTCSAF